MAVWHVPAETSDRYCCAEQVNILIAASYRSGKFVRNITNHFTQYTRGATEVMHEIMI
ncbi:MAG: hypothetical protein ABI939_08590 [Anaerolineaceae bacterium]